MCLCGACSTDCTVHDAHAELSVVVCTRVCVCDSCVIVVGKGLRKKRELGGEVFCVCFKRAEVGVDRTVHKIRGRPKMKCFELRRLAAVQNTLLGWRALRGYKLFVTILNMQSHIG